MYRAFSPKIMGDANVSQAFSLGCYVTAPLALWREYSQFLLSPHGWFDN